MATQILFVQGGGERVHDDWDHALVASLHSSLGPEYDIRYPRLPNEAEPEFAAWNTALVKELASLADGALLVGHSIGGTVLVHTLVGLKTRKSYGGLFLLAAPFVGPGGWPTDEFKPGPHLGADLPATMPVYLFHGSVDEEVPPSHLALYEQAIPQAIVRMLDGRDHQFGNDLSAVADDIRSIAPDPQSSS